MSTLFILGETVFSSALTLVSSQAYTLSFKFNKFGQHQVLAASQWKLPCGVSFALIILVTVMAQILFMSHKISTQYLCQC